MAGCRVFRIPMWVLALLVVWAGPAAAQQRPLRKPDLVRLLTNPSLTKGEIARRIRAACLAFDPTSRDRTDLRALGADAGIMTQIENCVRRKAAAARPSARPPARPAPARSRPAPRTAPRPVERAPSRPVVGPPATASVQPASIQLRPSEPARRVAVTVTVRDGRGNAVPGEAVEFRPLTPGLGVGAFAGRTSSRGLFVATFATNLLKRDGDIGIFVRGARLGTLSIVGAPVVLSAASTKFVTGADQRGVAGQALGHALLFEVRDTTGGPVAGRTVGFAATNAEVSPASGTTDAKGQIAVTVTAGHKAGAAVVTASVDSIRKQATLAVSPGPAATLIVQRDTVPVARAIEITSTKPVYLWVKAQDRFGNSLRVAGLRAAAGDGQVLQVAAVDTTGGMGRVELRARATGAAQLELQMGAARQAIAAQILLPLAGQGQWVVALRAGYTTFNYVYNPRFKSQGGPVAEVAVGRNVWRGLTVALAGTFAPVKADTGTGSKGVNLLDASLRLEYSAVPQAQVSPVVVLGGGSFQTTSAGIGNDIWHVSYFWLAGAGADFRVNPTTMGELRVMTHQLKDITSSYRRGPVGSIVTITAGVRFGF